MKGSILHIGNSEAHAVADDLIFRWKRGDTFYPFKTSGSTGPPKEITLTIEQLRISARNTFNYLNLENVSTVIVCLDPKFIGGAMMIFRALEFGWDIVQVDPNNIKAVLDHPAEFISLAPIQFRKLLTEDRSINYLNGFEAVLLGGSKLSQSDDVLSNLLSARVYHGYGMTETASHVALRQVNGPNERYFRSVGDVDLTTDNEGRIVINGAITANEALITHDIGVIHKEGLEILGRSDFVINSAGIKIHPELVESELEKAGAGVECLVVGVPDSELGEKCIVLTEKAFSLDWEDLKAQLELHNYYQPKEWVQVGSFPRTENGKINRRASMLLAQSF